MAFRHSLSALLLAGLLGACASLTSKAPLFSVTDQIGPPPLAEGTWIALGPDCSARNVRRSRYPKDCSPITIARLPDGAWSVRYRVDLATGLNPEERAQAETETARPLRMTIAPAVERRAPDTFSPLYVAEIVPTAPEEDILYAVIAPVGPLPARSILVLAGIGCSDILRDGPIDGIEAHYREVAAEAPALPDRTGAAADETPAAPVLSGCTASTQAAVREAARRALIENAATLADHKYVHVGRR